MECLTIPIDCVVIAALIRLSFASAAVAVARWLVTLIYSITENTDIDTGYDRGLTDPKVNITGLAGFTFRF